MSHSVILRDVALSRLGCPVAGPGWVAPKVTVSFPVERAAGAVTQAS